MKRIWLLIFILACSEFSESTHDVTMVLPRFIFPVQRPIMVRCVAEEQYELEVEIEANIGNGEDIPQDAIFGKSMGMAYNSINPSCQSHKRAVIFHMFPEKLCKGRQGLTKAIQDRETQQDARVDYLRATVDCSFQGIIPEGWPGIQMEVPKSAGSKRFGAFRCSARDNATDITRKAVGVVLPTSAGRPRQLTAGKLEYTIEHTNPDHGGIYLVTYPIRDFNQRLYQQSVFRIIIRACADDKFGPICEEECLDCKNGGACDMEDGTCVCPAGFGGPTCEKICGPNTFGGDCQYQCDENPEIGCKGKIFCRPDPLGCTCAAGFFGVVCNAKCERGKYGPDCESDCHCLKEHCDPVTGKCLDGGCAPGWMGQNCQDNCPPFSYGPDCEINCGSCYGELSCNGTSGECPGAMVREVGEGSAYSSEEMEHVQLDEDEETVYYCEYGYASPICDEPCNNGSWWRDCVRECHCLGGVACNSVSGECFPPTANDTVGSCSAGWVGRSCDQRCENGTYGLDCAEVCGSCANGSPCDTETGKCQLPGPEGGLCLPGFVPPYCDETCPDGYFGISCLLQCRCYNTTLCNAVDGSCEGECAEGYLGLGCQDKCSNGTFGLGCADECGKCLDKVPCHHDTGHCPYGCMLGWAGDTCHNATLCYEYECQNNATCEQDESIYRCLCQPGYAGGHCEKKLPPCHSMPCQNGGMCMDVDEDNYRCQCFFAYSGTNCEIFLDGMLRNNMSDLHAAIAALAAIALVLAIVGALAYKCRSDALKKARDLEACRNALADGRPGMHGRKEGTIRLPKRFRGKGPPKLVTMKAGNRRIRVSRKLLGKTSLFSDGSSCHLSRMTTNSLFNFYEHPKPGETKRGFLNQCNQEPPSLSNKHKNAGFHNNLTTNYPNVTRNEWLEQDLRWGGISRGKNIESTPTHLKNIARRKAMNNAKIPAGVPLADYRDLITQARNAEEEFEMEARRDRKQGPGVLANPNNISGNEYQRKADRVRRRSRPRPKMGKHKQAMTMPPSKEETGYPPPSIRISSPFPIRNKVSNGDIPARDKRESRLSQSLNTRSRYRGSIPNVLSTLDDTSYSHSRRKPPNRKNAHRKGHSRRHPKKKDHDSDNDYD